MRMPTLGNYDQPAGNIEDEATRNTRLQAERTAASGRSGLNATLDMKGSGLGLGGGQSRADEARQFAERNSHTVPQQSRSEQASNTRLQEQSRQAGIHLSAKKDAEKITPDQAFDIRAMFQVAKSIRSESMERYVSERGGNRKLDKMRAEMTAETGGYKLVKPDMQAMSQEFKAAGQAPNTKQTLVEALRERGEGAKIPDGKGNNYSLDKGQLVKTDANDRVVFRGSADKAHEKEANANKAKAASAGAEQ